MEHNESLELVADYSFFGCMDDIDDPLECGKLSLSTISSTSSIKSEVNQDKVHLIEYDSFQIWDKTPDLFQSWRALQTKEAEKRNVMERKLPSIDSNWVTVEYSECIMYHEWFWNDVGYCLSCYIKDLNCDLIHPWCQCEGNHVLPIQSPLDIKRLRRIKDTMKIMRTQGSLRKLTINGIERNLNEYRLNEQKFVSMINAFKNNHRKLASSIFSNNGIESIPHLLQERKLPIGSYTKLDNKIDLNDGNDTVKYHRTDEKIKNLIETSKFQKQRELGTNKNLTHVEKETNSSDSLSNNVDGTEAVASTPLLVRSKSIFQVKVNELKTGGTPARLEETKQIRAKIREEQLLRLQKQKEKTYKLSTENWRRRESQNDEGKISNANENKVAGYPNAKNDKSKCKEAHQIPVMEKVSCPYKDKSRNKSSTYLQAVKDSSNENMTHLKTSKSQDCTLSSRLTKLKLIESKLQKENDEMSERIISSPGVKRKATSINSKISMTQSVPINYGSTVNSCSYFPSQRLVNTNTVSKFQPMTSIKSRSR